MVRLQSAGICLGACVTLLGGCEPRSSNLRGEWHPTASLVVRDGDAALTLTLPVMQDTQPTWPGRGYVSKWELSPLEGDSLSIIGKVGGIALLRGDTIVLVDVYSGALLAAADGRVITAVLNPHGARLQRVRRLAADSGGDVYAFSDDGHVVVYALSASKLTQRHAFRTGIAAFDGCILNGQVVIFGQKPGSPNAIHVFSKTGQPTISFAPIYHSANYITTRYVIEGSVACLEQTNTIAVASTVLGEIHTFGADGRPMWWAVLRNYRAPSIIETNRGAAIKYPTPQYHLIQTLVPTTDHTGLVLQIARVHIPEHSTRHISSDTLVTFVIRDAVEPRVVAIEHWPRIFDMSPSATVVALNEPFPRVLLFAPLARR